MSPPRRSPRSRLDRAAEKAPGAPKSDAAPLATPPRAHPPLAQTPATTPQAAGSRPPPVTAILSAAPIPAAWTPAWREVRLRRDGTRPLRFAGCLIARHDGQAPGIALWHDLALYRVAPGGVPAAAGAPTAGYAVEIVARHVVDGQTRPACCHATLCATLDEALTRLESHDASGDVCPGISAPDLALDDPAVSACALALRAAALRGVSVDTLRRYRIGVGAFLANLGLRDL